MCVCVWHIFVMLELIDIRKFKNKELGAQMASNEADEMLNGVENEEVDVSIEENSRGSRFKWLDSLHLESSKVSRMPSNG